MILFIQKPENVHYSRVCLIIFIQSSILIQTVGKFYNHTLQKQPFFLKLIKFQFLGRECVRGEKRDSREKKDERKRSKNARQKVYGEREKERGEGFSSATCSEKPTVGRQLGSSEKRKRNRACTYTWHFIFVVFRLFLIAKVLHCLLPFGYVHALAEELHAQYSCMFRLTTKMFIIEPTDMLY